MVCIWEWRRLNKDVGAEESFQRVRLSRAHILLLPRKLILFSIIIIFCSNYYTTQSRSFQLVLME